MALALLGLQGMWMEYVPLYFFAAWMIVGTAWIFLRKRR
jgi:hypothetical protein